LISAAAAAKLGGLAKPDGVSPPLVMQSSLPVQVTSFIGRERDVAEVRGLLGATRLLTLTGAGGIGKTRLALQVAAEVRCQNPHGVVALVELAALADPGRVPETVAATLGIVKQADRPTVEVLAAALLPCRLLLLIDGCEHVVSGCAELANRLLLRCPNLSFLVTSREALGIEGETAWQVTSLSLPDVLGSPNVWGPPRLLEGLRGAAVEQVARSGSVRLFVQRASAASSGFALTERNAPAVALLCRLLDGIPFALELAAARVTELPVEHIAEQLNNALQPLSVGRHTMPCCQQTLLTTLDWSYKLLSKLERRLLERLAISATDWTLESARTLFDGEDTEGGAALSHLQKLIANSLVVAVPEADGSYCMRLPKTVREYVNERRRSTSPAPLTPGR
jgi:predicted ATPase